VGKIKNTEGSAMSVGSVAVRLKYGLYVGHLSKWFTFSQFLVVCLSLWCRLLGLLVTFCRLPQWGISEHFTVNQAQILIEALHLI
jgi:hypothetical protein